MRLGPPRQHDEVGVADLLPTCFPTRPLCSNAILREQYDEAVRKQTTMAGRLRGRGNCLRYVGLYYAALAVDSS